MFQFLKSKKEKMLEDDLKLQKRKALIEYSNLLSEILTLQLESDALKAELENFKIKFANQNDKIASLIVQNSKIANDLESKGEQLKNKNIEIKAELNGKTKTLFEYILKKRKTSNSSDERKFFDEILEFLGRLHD